MGALHNVKKDKFYQKSLRILNLYACVNTASKYMGEIIEMKGQIDEFVTVTGDINMCLRNL